MSLRNKSAGKEVLDVLEQYGEFPVSKLPVVIKKQPGTIMKAVSRLEIEGYIEVNKVYRRERTIRLTLKCRRRLGIESVSCNLPPKESRKLARANRLVESRAMFDQSAPAPGEYTEIKAIQRSGEAKALTSTRMTGVFSHFDTIFAVYSIHNGMFWNFSGEKSARNYIQHYLVKNVINSAIIFVNDIRVALKVFAPKRKGKKPFLSSKTCYEKMYIIPVDNDGVQQLRLFRQLENAREEYLKITFDEKERNISRWTLIDGKIDERNTSVMFNVDVVRIAKILELCETKLLDSLLIYCFDFQKNFFQKLLRNTHSL